MLFQSNPERAVRRYCMNFLIALVIVATGCQSSLDIRVQRVLHDPAASTLRPTSRLGGAVSRTIADLQNIDTAYAELVAKLELLKGSVNSNIARDFAADKRKADVNSTSTATTSTPTTATTATSVPATVASSTSTPPMPDSASSNPVTRPAETRAPASPPEFTQLDGPIRNISPRRELIAEHLSTLRNFFTETDVVGIAPSIVWRLRQIEAWAAIEQATLSTLLSDLDRNFTGGETGNRWIDDAVGSQVFKTGLSEIRSRVGQIAASCARLELGSAQIAFGGFQQLGVYEINPADPEWRAVFKRPCPNASLWNKLAAGGVELASEPLTSVSVGASGDSSLMLVMETPGQVRLYQLSNDPTQLARNIALVVQKVTLVALKFATMGM